VVGPTPCSWLASVDRSTHGAVSAVARPLHTGQRKTQLPRRRRRCSRRSALLLGVRGRAGHCADTRSNAPVGREASSRPPRTQCTRTPASRAWRPARSSTTYDRSSAVRPSPAGPARPRLRPRRTRIQCPTRLEVCRLGDQNRVGLRAPYLPGAGVHLVPLRGAVVGPGVSVTYLQVPGGDAAVRVRAEPCVCHWYSLAHARRPDNDVANPAIVSRSACHVLAPRQWRPVSSGRPGGAVDGSRTASALVGLR
jgi:hypothetical protein